MTTLSPDTPTGFLAEAQGYIDSLREVLAGRETAASGQDCLDEIYGGVQILGSAMDILGFDHVAELAASAQELLEPLVGAGKGLTKKIEKQLLDTLGQIETHVQALTDSDGNSLPENDKPGLAISPDLPVELLEIFALEAQDHSQAIQTGLEHLQKDPADGETLGEVRRATHTLKGAAAAIGVNPVAHLAHLMEELIEGYLEGGKPLTAQATELLIDSADALGELIESDPANDLSGLVESIDARYKQLLGDAYTPSETFGSLTPSEDESSPGKVERPENLLRIPLSDIDQLINRVGEIVINRATLEGHLGALDELMIELDHSSRRLRRVTHDMDAQVESTPLKKVDGSDDAYDIFDPLELDRYTLLHQLTRELEEVAADTDGINTDLRYLTGEFDAVVNRERRLTTELQDGLMATRLVSFHEIETRLRRTVRRTARDLDKQIELVLSGFDTEVDKTILDTLVDPLMHLLRNAVDHGVESPDSRQTANKPPTGTITLLVVRERGRVVLHLSDDGAGIDTDQVHRHATSLGMLGNGRVSDDRLLDVLFEEGFSMADEVTQTSGRGVGLDIVRRAVRHLQGTVRVNTKRGQGTTFTISVPVTLAITRALFVRSCDQLFAIPLEQISAVMRLEPEALDEIRGEGMIRYEERALSVFDLATYVGLEKKSSGNAQRYGLLIDVGNQETVVIVDGLAGTQEAVIKSLGTHLRRVHGISGGTIGGDGRVILILDVAELVESELNTYQLIDTSPPEVAQTPSADSLHALVVDDSLSVRRVVCSVLERAGWQTTAAKDGIEALETLSMLHPDVALVDIEMPRMNGYELLTRIKTDSNLQDMPVVFLTSRSASKHRDRATKLGVDGYLVKPYREEELLNELVRVTQKQP
jgi:chemosensory pili system protein ChpA (sensor histidine kinase/response regulator)